MIDPLELSIGDGPIEFSKLSICSNKVIAMKSLPCVLIPSVVLIHKRLEQWVVTSATKFRTRIEWSLACKRISNEEEGEEI